MMTMITTTITLVVTANQKLWNRVRFFALYTNSICIQQQMLHKLMQEMNDKNATHRN